jgi:ABC-type sulfate transport system substrate-binding protein
LNFQPIYYVHIGQNKIGVKEFINSKKIQIALLPLINKLKNMKKIILSTLTVMAIVSMAIAQDVKSSDVSAAAKSALLKKYPKATKVTWEKENGNFEANWGGKSGEDMSVQFSPAGAFVEQVVAISPNELPPAIAVYVKQHYKGAKITEAGKVTDANGATKYEAEVKGKDVIFDEKGNFLKKE